MRDKLSFESAAELKAVMLSMQEARKQLLRIAMRLDKRDPQFTKTISIISAAEAKIDAAQRFYFPRGRKPNTSRRSDRRSQTLIRNNCSENPSGSIHEHFGVLHKIPSEPS